MRRDWASDIDITGPSSSTCRRFDEDARREPSAKKTYGRNDMTLMQVGLDDKYDLEARRIYLSGVQALVRLPMLQRERDRAAGLNTGGFISGYRGSPLGMYDSALGRARKFLDLHDVRVQPAINEDLA